MARKIDDIGKRNKYKDEKFLGKRSTQDEYTGRRLFFKSNNENYKRPTSKTMNIDHVTPIDVVERRFYYLSDKSRKQIANNFYNLSTTNEHLNKSKGDLENHEYLLRQLKKGKPENWKTATNMLGMEANARIHQRVEATELYVRENVDPKILDTISNAYNDGKSAAAYGGSKTAVISSVYNISSCIKGEQTASDALKNVGKDTVKSVRDNALTASSVSVITDVLKDSDSELIKMLGQKEVPAKTITAVSIVGDTVIKWGTGEITTAECIGDLVGNGCVIGGEHLGRTGGIATGTAVGYFFGGPIGGEIGTVVGGVVGEALGGMMTSALVNSFGEEFRRLQLEEQHRQQEMLEAILKYYAEEKRREEVKFLIETRTEYAVKQSVISILSSNIFQDIIVDSFDYFLTHKDIEYKIAECVLVNLQLKEYCERLQISIDKYFTGYEYCFSQVLNEMDRALEMGDYNSAIASVNKVTSVFGKKPLIEDTKDFKKKIFSNDDLFF